MKRLLALLVFALGAVAAVPSFAQYYNSWGGNPSSRNYWGNENRIIRPRPIVRADQGLGVGEWRYGGSYGWSNYPQPPSQGYYPSYQYSYPQRYYDTPPLRGYPVPQQGHGHLSNPNRLYGPLYNNPYISPYGYTRPSGVAVILDALTRPRYY